MKAGARKNPRIDIASIRREQIVEAAVAVIAEQGLQHLSLSEIENKVGMSRGQLTYYFKTKEAILLAVFDHLVEMMCQRQGKGADGATAACQPVGWEEVVHWVLDKILEQPPAHPEFGCLQYTFLSQIGHRDDYRRRLASLYEEWRGHMAELLTRQFARRSFGRKFSARSLASLIQAIFHGVAMQCAADPEAFNHQEMLNLVLDMLGTYLESPGTKAGKKQAQKRPARSTSRLISNGVHHE